MKQSIIFLFYIFLAHSLLAQKVVEVPYTLDDRDRLIRVESRLDALESKMDAEFLIVETKFESQQAQLNDLKSMFFWGFGTLISLFLFMLGFIIWDRRSALKPALDKAADANEKSTNLHFVLREYARKKTDLAEIMKDHGLM